MENALNDLENDFSVAQQLYVRIQCAVQLSPVRYRYHEKGEIKALLANCKIKCQIAIICSQFAKTMKDKTTI